MVDQEATTDAPMTTDASLAVGTAPVPVTAPDPEPSQAPVPPPPWLANFASMAEPPQAPVPPPPMTAPVDKVLRWLADVASVAGSPDGIDVSTTTRQIDVAAPNQHLFAHWQAIIGAVARPTRHDALGATILAMTIYPGLWSVTIHAHVRTIP